MTGESVVIVAMHDGFYGCGTGAGRSNRAFLQVLVDVLDPAVMPIRLAEISPEYDAQWHQDTLGLLERVGAEVAPVDNGTFGATRFGGLDAFCQASAQAATVIPFFLGRARQALVVASDAPFFGLSPLLAEDQAGCVVNVMHATARPARARR